MIAADCEGMAKHRYLRLAQVGLAQREWHSVKFVGTSIGHEYLPYEKPR
jgi:hypothetical protein